MSRHLQLGILLLSLLQVAVAWGADTSAQEMQKLLESGSAGKAYELGLTRLPKEAGDPQFDFQFGLAALQVGHPEQSVFAFERVLLQFPDNDRVRLELARAQFLLGNYPEARTQFEIVLTHKPPPNVRERVELFLAKIREQEKSVRPVWHGHTAFRVGYDSNVNSATSTSAIVVPALGPVTLSAGSLALSGDFAEYELGGEGLRPISNKKALFGAATAIVRDNFNVQDGFNQQFDTTTFQLRGGISFLGKNSLFRLPVQYETLLLDNKEFRNLFLIGGEWEKPFGRSERLTLTGQIGGVRYPNESFRNVNLGLAAAAWTHRFARANGQFSLGLYYGDEPAVESSAAAKANGRDYVGLYGGVQWNVTPLHLIYFNGNIQAIDYKAPQPVFDETRRDTFYEARLGWSWRFRPKWTINTELKYDNDNSNIELFSFDRTQVFSGVRFDFH